MLHVLQVFVSALLSGAQVTFLQTVRQQTLDTCSCSEALLLQHLGIKRRAVQKNESLLFSKKDKNLNIGYRIPAIFKKKIFKSVSESDKFIFKIIILF